MILLHNFIYKSIIKIYLFSLIQFNSNKKKTLTDGLALLLSFSVHEKCEMEEKKQLYFLFHRF